MLLSLIYQHTNNIHDDLFLKKKKKSSPNYFIALVPHIAFRLIFAPFKPSSNTQNQKAKQRSEN